MNWEELEIIGTTTKVANGPVRLSPIYRKRGVIGEVLVPLDNDDGVFPPTTLQEPIEWFDDLVEMELAEIFAIPIQAKAEHRLMKFSTLPELVSVASVESRLQEWKCRTV